MDHNAYREEQLFCEDVPIAEIAAIVGTPTYVYSAATLIDHYNRIAAAFGELKPLICFSIKSCQNLHILKLLAGYGAGMDVVSGGELFRAMRSGTDPGRIVYAGVGKTDDEINAAIDAGIGWFNIESEAELENLIALAGTKKRRVRAALRVNPDVDPKTHRHTTTGKKETKFGVDIERARRVFAQYGRSEHVHLCGIHLHIGSPIYTVEPYTQAIGKALALIDDLRADGFEIDTIDIGGGFGADYETGQSPPAGHYADHLVPMLRGKGLQVILEPGRSIAGNAGLLVTRTLYMKHSGDRQFAIVDAAMTDLIRPALYEAYHFVWPVRPGAGFIPDGIGKRIQFPGTITVDVVGGVCETVDYLARDRQLPPVRRGDLLAVFTAGAYGFVMSSHYNSRPNAAEVLVEGDTFRVIRRRESYEDLLTAENV